MAANLKKGVKLARGSYLEVDVDGLTWRITKQDSGSVIFELYTSLGYTEIERPPETVERLWELIRRPAEGKQPH
jgi:hypothetical protein